MELVLRVPYLVAAEFSKNRREVASQLGQEGVLVVVQEMVRVLLGWLRD